MLVKHQLAMQQLLTTKKKFVLVNERFLFAQCKNGLIPCG